MAPKKKGNGKADTPDVPEDAPTADLSKEQLEKLVAVLRKNLETERTEVASTLKLMEEEVKERNFVQLERDKIQTFWDISKEQLDEKKAELRNKDREIEEAEERHQAEISEYKQKIRYLLHETHNKKTQLKVDEVHAMKLLLEEQAEVENELRKRLHGMGVALKEQQLASDAQIKMLRLKHDEEMTEVRSQFEKQVQEIRAKNNEKLQKMYDDEDLKHKNEVHQMELKNREHFITLTKNHETAFRDTQNHYSDINSRNEQIIITLKEEKEELKKKNEKLDKDMSALLQQNQSLTRQELRSAEEVERLRKQLRNYKTDKALLVKTKARIRETDDEINVLKMEKEILENKLNQVQRDYDELYEKFSEAILEVQKKSDMKILLVQKKLDALETK